MSLLTKVIFCTRHDHLDVLEGAELVAGDEKSDKVGHGGDRARVEVGQGGVRAETVSTMMVTIQVLITLRAHCRLWK